MALTDSDQVDDSAPTGATPEKAASEPAAKAKKAKKDGLTFTDPGCRTEVRIGALLMLGAIFMWLFLGPALSAKIYLLGVPLLLIGVPLQAIQGRKQNRPGFPWKLGVVFTLFGLVMIPDMLYREEIGGAISVQPMAPLLLAAGVWILAWWPVSGRYTLSEEAASAH